MTIRKVLFLCTGNSARSQMAEGLVNHFLKDRWQAFSAGVQPADRVHPLAIQVLQELNIDIRKNSPKSLQRYRYENFDLVITVCDQAAQQCPAWLGRGQLVHLGFPDPALYAGSEEECLNFFRGVREALRLRILPFLETWEPTPNNPILGIVPR